MDYTIKRKVLLERLLDVELHGPEEHSIFYEDSSATVSRTLFYGQEWSLWQLEMLTFAFVDMLATDYVLATIITAIVTMVSIDTFPSPIRLLSLSLSFTHTQTISLLKAVFTQRNITRKTLIDKRFLI